MSTEQDFVRYGQASAAKLTLDFLDDHFSGLQARLDQEIFHKLDKGVAITAQEALQFIYMKHANYCLLKNISNKLQAGQNASARLKPFLDGEGA